MPNVHIAHHPTLRLDSLHDHVHLQKGVVSILARTLKDVALGRSPSSPPRISRRPPSLHPAGLYFSPPQRDPTTQRPQHHHQRSPPRPRAPPAGHVSPLLRHHRPGPAPQHQSPAQQQEQHSYAAALKGPASTSNTDMGEIKHLLSLICTRLMGCVQTTDPSPHKYPSDLSHPAELGEGHSPFSLMQSDRAEIDRAFR
ncbi:hypothetical protein SKAU_G00366590 [Synaphobranchus kaupii]|uniref:Uncharacterized protein n=1 Tax=Synaphobranchus kaupii TaxID=118154 RepID=A0A9Q1IDE4_SYNKA|nr:hypothetical protein SKAU_G00366590 [Synaphobranchus kaupii]